PQHQTGRREHPLNHGPWCPVGGAMSDAAEALGAFATGTTAVSLIIMGALLGLTSGDPKRVAEARSVLAGVLGDMMTKTIVGIAERRRQIEADMTKAREFDATLPE